MVGRNVDDDTNAAVHKMSSQIENLTFKLSRVNSLELQPETGPSPVDLRRPYLQKTLTSFVGKASGPEPVKGRRPFKETDFVSFHPTDASLYDGEWSVPSYYQVSTVIMTEKTFY